MLHGHRPKRRHYSFSFLDSTQQFSRYILFLFFFQLLSVSSSTWAWTWAEPRKRVNNPAQPNRASQPTTTTSCSKQDPCPSPSPFRRERWPPRLSWRCCWPRRWRELRPVATSSTMTTRPPRSPGAPTILSWFVGFLACFPLHIPKHLSNVAHIFYWTEYLFLFVTWAIARVSLPFHFAPEFNL
jgi:hypothetical protein